MSAFHFTLTSQPIDLSLFQLKDERAGARLSFEGIVRNHHEGKAVDSLEYVAYDSMAQKEGQKIVEELKFELPCWGISCAHRTGHLKIGECALYAQVLASHRKEAYVVLEKLIDEIKSRLPMWKKEFYLEGRELKSHWVNCCAH